LADVPRDAPGCFAAAQFFGFWPVATDYVLMADRCFRSEADIDGFLRALHPVAIDPERTLTSTTATNKIIGPPQARGESKQFARQVRPFMRLSRC
jgi:hypothetical protein